MTMTQMASPNLGDLGLLESTTQRDMNNVDDVTEETRRNMRMEEGNISVRDS